MRHQKTRHKLSRDASHRKALLANLCIEMIDHERIKTTEAKAKAVKPELEQLITLAKRGDLHARRQAMSALQHPDKGVIYKLFDEIAPRYAERPGGYTRILKLGPRRSDSTEMVYLELRLTTKLTLEYDGTHFYGWAIQPQKRTVEGELTRALRTLLRAPELVLTVAGRTDRGVHALGQVVSYAGPPPALRSLNALLPDDIGALAAEPAPDGFSARHSALTRSYAYRVHTRREGPSPFALGRALWWPHRVDLELLQGCAAALVGEHDFTAFTPSDTYHQRFCRIVSAASWACTGPEALEFRIEADAFMRNMNRVLVGTMLEVAGGRRTLEDFCALLDGAPRAAAGPTAPAHGLYLVGVRY